LGFCAAVLCLVRPAAATERHFGYTYESGVLNPGKAELEPWTTWRFGRADYFSRFDQRIEFELGVIQNLQTAFYWNFEAKSEDVTVTDATTNPPTTKLERQTELAFASVSSEWKYKLMDPMADPLGFALYFEGSLGPVEAELEGKLIFDKRLKSVLLAANLVGEYEWEFDQPDKTVREATLELDLAAGYFLNPRFSVGLELRPVFEFEGLDFEHAEMYAGPTLGYASERWWAALSIMPQAFAFKGATSGNQNLESQERVQTRVLMGMDL
jgi:hypothetical protein